MSRLRATWDRVWHAPADLHMAALFRIAFAVLVFLSFAFQAPYVELWWGAQGLVPKRIGMAITSSWGGSLFWLLPGTDLVAWVGWILVLLHASLLALGWHTRVQAAALFVWLVSFQNRNVAILDGEDTLFRMFAFYLIFVPCAEVWSLDARRRGGPPSDGGSGWAWRFIQLNTAFAFLIAGVEKLPGQDWQQGHALLYVFRLDDLSLHGWIPAFVRDSLLASQLMSWGTLVMELALPVLVWFRPTRRACVVVAILFHLALEYTMNLYLFEWLMILGWSSFLEWERDVAPVVRRIRGA